MIAKGRESVDRSIQKEISAAGGRDIPDHIDVTVPVYDLQGSREDLQTVRLLVDVREDNGAFLFELTAVLNTLREAERWALEHVMARFEERLSVTVPVYFAEPA